MSRDKEVTESRQPYATNAAVPHMPPPYFGSYATSPPGYALGLGPPPPHPPSSSAPHIDDKGPHGGYHPYASAQTGSAPSHIPSNGHHVYSNPNSSSAATTSKQADNAPHHAQGVLSSQNTNNTSKTPYPAPQVQGGPESSMGYAVHDSWRSHPPQPPYGQHAAASMPPGMMGPPRDAPPPHPGYAHWHHHQHHPHPPPPSYGPPNYWASAPPPPPPPPPHSTASHVQGHAELPPKSPPQPHQRNKAAAAAAAAKPYEQAQYSAADYDDRVPRATSPSQIENHHRDEVQHMGCTCKKTRCLKLYCQCFGAKLYCGHNCRCLNCFNTHAHEKTRRDAIQMILIRNPGAFDTKFKKAPGAVDTGSAPTVSTEDGSTASRVLTHKLGCKCRKSACLKKYCECYAGNVKCSPNCRCMGCKNMGTITPNAEPTGNFAIAPNPSGSHHSSYPSHPTTILPTPQQHEVSNSSDGIHGATGEPWVAAQNLTFMKHGSPDKKKQSRAHHEGDIPSLASSSEGTSPGEAVRMRDKEDEEGAKALLLAAVAMTEFGQSSPRKFSEENFRKRPFATEATSRAPSSKTSKTSSGPAKQKLSW